MSDLENEYDLVTLRHMGVVGLHNFWISDADSADDLEDMMDLVVDCTGVASPAKNKVHIKPTGKNNHTWTITDLDRIVKLVNPYINAGKKVLIHCERGRSRSACAVAAVLLDRGVVHSVDDALIAVTHASKKPNSHTVKSLREWWAVKHPQPKLF